MKILVLELVRAFSMFSLSQLLSTGSFLRDAFGVGLIDAEVRDQQAAAARPDDVGGQMPLAPFRTAAPRPADTADTPPRATALHTRRSRLRTRPELLSY